MKKSLNKKILYGLYLFSLLFTYTEGFGLRGEGSWGGLGNENFGPFGLLQLVVLFISIIIAIQSGGFLFCRNSRTSSGVKWFLALFLIIILQLLFQSAVVDVDKISKYSNLIKLKHWLILFSIPALYHYLGIKGSLDTIKLSGLISAIIVIVVVVGNVQGTAIKTMQSTDVTHAFRVLMPTSSLIAFSFFLFLSSYKEGQRLTDFLSVVTCFVASFIQLHRSSVIALIVATVLFIILELKFSMQKFLKYAVLGIVSIYVLNFIFKSVDYSYTMLGDFFAESNERISEGSDNGASMRLGMIRNGLAFVIQNYYILGLGLDWTPIQNAVDYNFFQFAETPTSDNGYFNIIIVFGVLGFLLFLSMLSCLLWSSFRNRRKEIFIDYRIASAGLFYYLVYTIMVSLGGDHFFFDPIFPLVIGMILLNDTIIRKVARNQFG